MPKFSIGDTVEFDQDEMFLETAVTEGIVLELVPSGDAECDEPDHYNAHHPDVTNEPCYLVQPNDPLAKSFVFCECELRMGVGNRV